MKLNLQNLALTGALILANACGGQKSSTSPIGKTDAKVRINNKISTDITVSTTGTEVCGKFTLRPYYFDAITGLPTPADKNNDGTITFTTGAGIPDPLAQPIEGCISSSPIDPATNSNWGYMGTFSDYTDCNTGAALANVVPTGGVQVQTWFMCKANLDNAANITARVSLVASDSSGYANIGTTVEATPVVAACKYADQTNLITKRTIGLKDANVAPGDFLTIKYKIASIEKSLVFAAVARNAPLISQTDFYIGLDSSETLANLVERMKQIQELNLVTTISLVQRAQKKIAELSMIDSSQPVAIGDSSAAFYYDTIESYVGTSFEADATSELGATIGDEQALIAIKDGRDLDAVFVSKVSNGTTSDIAFAGTFYQTAPTTVALPSETLLQTFPSCVNPDQFDSTGTFQGPGKATALYVNNAQAQCSTTAFTGDARGTTPSLATTFVIPGKGYANAQIIDADTITIATSQSTNFANLRDYQAMAQGVAYRATNEFSREFVSLTALLGVEAGIFSAVSIVAALDGDNYGNLYVIVKHNASNRFGYITLSMNGSRVGTFWDLNMVYKRIVAEQIAKKVAVGDTHARQAIAQYPTLAEAQCRGLTGEINGCMTAEDLKARTNCSVPLPCDTSSSSDVAGMLSDVNANCATHNSSLSLAIPTDYCSMSDIEQADFVTSYGNYAAAYLDCSGTCTGMTLPAGCEQASCVFTNTDETTLATTISSSAYCGDSGEFVSNSGFAFPSGFCSTDPAALTTAYEAYVTAYIACMGHCDKGMATPAACGNDGSSCPAIDPTSCITNP